MRAYKAANRERINRQNREYKARNRPPRAIVRDRYGLSRGDRDDLYMGQGGDCALCEATLGTGRDSQIDHDHAIGLGKREAVRGILHARCNSLVAVVENGQWTGAGYAYPSLSAYGRDPYHDLLLVGLYLARPYPFA